VNAFALITQEGTYQVTGTNAINGCTSTAEITIGSDGNLPVVSINNLTGTFELGCDTTQIDVEVATNVVDGVFVWNNGLPSSSTQSLLDQGTYTVTVTDPVSGTDDLSAYFLNTDYLKFVVDKDANFELSDFEHVSGYASRSAQIMTRAQLVVDHLACQGILVNGEA
jgi:hypothetical protein